MLVSIPSQVGYGALFTAVFAESAGVPLPGETSVLAAGVLAGRGNLNLLVVIAAATVAAILGDNAGYWIGRRGGRRVLERDGFLAGHRRHALAAGEVFFARHGAKTVFWGRWVVGVRVVAAVLAGSTGMRWRTFATYNATGAIAWASTLACLAAITGPAGAVAVYVAGVIAAGGGFGALVLGARRRRRGRGGQISDAEPVSAGT